MQPLLSSGQGLTTTYWTYPGFMDDNYGPGWVRVVELGWVVIVVELPGRVQAWKLMNLRDPNIIFEKVWLDPIQRIPSKHPKTPYLSNHSPGCRPRGFVSFWIEPPGLMKNLSQRKTLGHLVFVEWFPTIKNPPKLGIWQECDMLFVVFFLQPPLAGRKSKGSQQKCGWFPILGISCFTTNMSCLLSFSMEKMRSELAEGTTAEFPNDPKMVQKSDDHMISPSWDV